MSTPSTQTVLKYSKQFVPAFVFLRRPTDPTGDRFEGEALDVSYRPLPGLDGLAFQPKDGERLVNAYSAGALDKALVVGTDEEGRPSDTYKLTVAKRAMGELAVTDQRLVALVDRAESPIVPISRKTGVFLAVVMPHDKVEIVTVAWRKTAFGRDKETRMAIECRSRPGLLVIDSVVGIRDGNRYQRYDGGLTLIANEIIDAAAHARLAAPAVADKERQLCEAAIRRERTVTDDGRVVAKLSP